MNWLPPPQDFRGRLAAAGGRPGPPGDALGRSSRSATPGSRSSRRCSSTRRSPAPPPRPSRARARLEPVRLALLASGTADHLLPGIRVAGLRRGLRIAAHAGGYGQYRQELLDPGGLAAFRPDAVLLALASRDFLGAVPLAASAEAADAAVAAAVADLRALWARAAARGWVGALVIQQTFLDLEPPLFGGLDAARARGAGAARPAPERRARRCRRRRGRAPPRPRPRRRPRRARRLARSGALAAGQDGDRPAGGADVRRTGRRGSSPPPAASRGNAWCSTSTTPSGAG